MPPRSSASKTGRRPALVCAVTVAALVFLGRFWQFRSFGLYEDDHFRISTYLDWVWQQIPHYMYLLALWFRFNRIGHEYLIYGLGYTGWRAGGLPAMYLIAFLILAANAVLLAVLLRRLNFPWIAACFGGTFLILFPADISQVFLTHSLGIHPGMTLFLLAALLYLASRPWLALLAAAPVLFIYESIYLVYLLVPVLGFIAGRVAWRRATLHSAIAAALFGVLALLRVQFADARTVSAAGRLPELIPTVLRNVITGPIQAFRWTFAEAGAAAMDIGGPRLLAFLAAAAISGAAFWWLSRREGACPESPRLALRYLAVGAGMMFVSYPLLFELDPADIGGRASRIHLAAVLGASLVVASLVRLLESRLRSRSTRAAGIAVLATVTGLLVLNGFRVQDHYVLVWRYQQAMWTDIMEQSPDLDSGHLILVKLGDLHHSSGFHPWAWEHSRLAERLYEFPRGKTPPRLFFLWYDWPDRAAATGNLFDGVHLVTDGRDILDQHAGQPIHFYEASDGRLRRIYGPVVTGDYVFEVSHPVAAGTPPKYPPRVLREVLLLPDTARPVDYFWGE